MKTLIAVVLVLAGSSAAQAQVDLRNSYNSPHIYAPNGQYLGNLNRNQLDPNSVANPLGAGSPLRPNGINNPLSPNYTPGLVPQRCYGLRC